MAVYYVAPNGSDTGPGTLASPMSLKKASGDTAWTPAPGDIFELRGGIYSGTWNQRASGTAGNPLLYRPYGSETAYIDGSRNAPNLTKASPNPWTDVGGETGWSGPVSYTSQVGSESNVYSKSLNAGSHSAMWVNQPEAGMGANKTAGVFTCLWRMDTPLGYNANPNGEIHSYNSAHDNFPGTTIRKHEWHSQFDVGRTSGTCYVRLYDSNDINPNNHQIYYSTTRWGFKGDNGISYVTIDGIDHRIKIWRFFQPVNFGDNSSNIKLLNCEVAFSGHDHGIWTGNPATSPTIEGNRIVACGNMMAHTGDGVWMTSGAGTWNFNNNYVAYAGHTGVTLRDDGGYTLAHIENNTIKWIGGAGLFCRGLGPGSTIKYNKISYAAVAGGADRTTYSHPVGHEAFRISGGDGVTISRNQMYKSGSGVGLVVFTGLVFKNITFIHNTVFETESYGFDFRSDFTGAPPAADLDNIVVANNIFHDLAINTSASQTIGQAFLTRVQDLSGYLSKMKFWSNQILSGLGAGGNVWWRKDGTAGGTANTFAAFDTEFPSTSREGGNNNNIHGDPIFLSEVFGNPNFLELDGGAPSPCIDAGTSTYTDSEVTDGNPDMGALEEGGGGGQPPNQAPVIQNLSGNVTTGAAPLTVNFSCSATDDQTSAGNLQYDWVFGDVNSGGNNTASGTGSGAANQSHTYNHPGVYIAQVTVTDDDASPLTDVETLQITVTNSAAGVLQTAVDAAGYTFTDGGGGANPNPGQTPDKVMDERFLNSVPAGDEFTEAWSRTEINTSPKWYQIDLGTTKTITRMATSFYRWETGRSVTFNWEYNTVDSWPGTAIISSYQSLTGSGNEFTEVRFSPISARYIRVTLNSHTDQPGSNFATVWEHRVWIDPASGGTGAQIPVIVVTDSKGRAESAPFGPGFLRDSLGAGTYNDRRWLMGPIASGPTWAQWDFGSDKVVKTINFDFYKASKGIVYTYNILRATNAAPTTMINVLTGQTNGTELTTEHVLGSTVTARYIRLEFTGAAGAACASCWEGRFFEEAP